ncbi:hypothetical protein L916_10651 [Phytophthora nicotianae]|uniref:DDE Tnp4 domain-containing protein n=1 Tax=Phytophthora nicotianae TaxID=4792 RepID=W2IU64_PHYNI|nr:hypothetical protein L916_10651 [Phytophthora nicotianae]
MQDEAFTTPAAAAAAAPADDGQREELSEKRCAHLTSTVSLARHQQRQWSRQVQAKEPLLEGVWGFVDGKNYRVQSPTDAYLQNAHYNVLVTGTLCYGVDGTLVWGRHNLPGSWNDGETSRQLQLRLADPLWTVEGCGVVADSAFPVSRALFGRIRTPLKD